MAQEDIKDKIARYLKQHLESPVETITFRDKSLTKVQGYLEAYRLSKRIFIEVRFALTSINKRLYTGRIILQKESQD